MPLRKQNLPWLASIAALLALAGLSAPTAGLGLALLGCGALALLTSLPFDRQRLRPDRPRLRADRLRDALPSFSSPRPPANLSAAAREATERARRYTGSNLTPTLTLLDIGLICAQTGPHGLTMHKGRSFSSDVDGLRPYVSLLVPEHEAERSARLRFEIIDQRGKPRFIHEQEIWLREGQRDVLSENQLPLGADPPVARSAGEWELRVSVDAAVLGILTFVVTPSLRRRAAELERRAAKQRRDGPPGFAELMQEPRRPE